MGEVMPTEQGDSSSGSVPPKLEPLPDGYDSSPEVSSPDAEAEAPAQQSDAPPVVKRKGGRKPIYATSEERKQRNRQAQAAFRERRTEYIKQLEETIKQQEAQLQSLQQSHRSAADECLMLRYKNSLLERLLLEKGIDVQAELRMKGSPTSGPNRVPATSSTSHASPMQRAMMNRQQHARANSNVGTLTRQSTAPSSHSPTFHTTPSSHQSPTSTGKSPTTFVVQGGISPTTSDLQAQPQMQPRPAQPNPPTTFINHQHAGGIQPPSRRSTAPTAPSQNYHSSAISSGGFYPTSFQKHYDQLEQEYAHDAQADMMVDQPDVDSTHDTPPDSFPSNFGQQSFPAQPQPPPPLHQRNHSTQQSPLQTQQATPAVTDPSSQHNIYAHGPGHPLFDPFDPMLDADPFGLTASMQFSTPFTYGQSPQHTAQPSSGPASGGQEAG